MAGMNIQQRYDDIAEKSGLSEEIIRRVFKATRESLAESLKHGERATLPGICTITPELRNKINLGGDSMSTYIKLKASASSAMETELEKLQGFKSESDAQAKLSKEEENLKKLNLLDNYELPSYRPDRSQIRTTQINALL